MKVGDYTITDDDFYEYTTEAMDMIEKQLQPFKAKLIKKILEEITIMKPEIKIILESGKTEDEMLDMIQKKAIEKGLKSFLLMFVPSIDGKPLPFRGYNKVFDFEP